MIPANTTNTSNNTNTNDTITDNTSTNTSDPIPNHQHLRSLAWRLGQKGARAVKYGTPSRTSALLPLAPLCKSFYLVALKYALILIFVVFVLLLSL
jgi:hypothetical protein